MRPFVDCACCSVFSRRNRVEKNTPRIRRYNLPPAIVECPRRKLLCNGECLRTGHLLSRSSHSTRFWSNNDSLPILPYSGENAQKFASDMADSLRMRYSSNSRPQFSEMKIGNIRASSVTYGIDNANDQKVTAFVQGGKIYCIVTSYKHSEEYTFSKLVRNVITSWRF